MVAGGSRAVMLYLIQICSAERFALARDIDPAYGAAFDRAREGRRRGLRLALQHRLRRARPGRPGADPGAAHACVRRPRELIEKLNIGGVRPRGRGQAASIHDLRRCGARAAAQDRTDQALRPGGLRGHAQGRAAGGRVPRHAQPPRSSRACRPRSIDRLVFEFGRDHNAMPATLMYRGYRHSTCTSINHVVCHGIPTDKPLREGDIVNIDVTLIVDGWHGDSSRMYRGRRNPPQGRAADRGHLRGDDARHRRGAGRAPPPATSAHAIQTYVEPQHMSVVRDFCGHGLGRLFHDEPNIVHVGRPGEGIVLKPGMFFTIEPMINLGRAAREGPVRRLDRGDPRPLAVGAVRAFGRRDRERGRDLHAVAQGARQAALPELTFRARLRGPQCGPALNTQTLRPMGCAILAPGHRPHSKSRNMSRCPQGGCHG